ncbi:hypothetical protein ACLIYM_25365 [Streptomyces fenghuangensis]
MAERPHGYARYKLDGCRCYTCGWARARYEENRQRAIAYGTWQPHVPAAPVREHITQLQQCGMGLRAIAAAAGVDRKRLQAILSGRPERGTGPQEKVRPALATAVLAVEPTLDTLGGSTVIGATGTRRRLQALIARGFPQAVLAARLGMTPGNFNSTLGRDRTIARTARAVRALYDELSLADPDGHGASPAGITRARRYAAEHCWAPVGAWDEETIDDPAAFPDWTGKCGTPQGAGAHRYHRILPVCQPCKDALTEHRREQRQAAREVAA